MPLLVCGTPIGNLDDVTLRVLAALREADAVLCEDTRHTAILLSRHGVRARELLSLHRHNEEARTAEVIGRLRDGATVALVSDAGMPGIADPGGRLVSHALAAACAVVVLPGASAVTAALVVSGFVGDGPFRFVGWLPRKEAERRTLWARLVSEEDPVVAFESPKRVRSSLASLAAFDPTRHVCVCRELTKLHETVIRGPAGEVAAALETEPRGEITVVIAPSSTGTRASDLEARHEQAAHEAIRDLVESGTPRRVATAVVGRLTGVARNDLYRGGLSA
jgi:16S rRNA (cytidine1402-2'-O)-methyltransferase